MKENLNEEIIRNRELMGLPVNENFLDKLKDLFGGAYDKILDFLDDNEDEVEMKFGEAPEFPSDLQNLLDRVKEEIPGVDKDNICRELKINGGGYMPDNGSVDSQAEMDAKSLLKKFNQTFGLKAGIVSGYRSWDDQIDNFASKASSRGVDSTQNANTIPGFSQHHSGKCFDIYSVNSSDWDTEKTEWVRDHAGDYGFEVTYQNEKNGRIAEPWHIVKREVEFTPIAGWQGWCSSKGIESLEDNDVEEIARYYEEETNNDLDRDNSEILKSFFDDEGITFNDVDSGGDMDKDAATKFMAVLKSLKNFAPEVSVRITSGNDKFHMRYPSSNHAKGRALDLVFTPKNEDTTQKVYQVFCKSREKLPGFSFIDEYRFPSRGATGGHFHISYNPTNIEDLNSTMRICNEINETEDESSVS